MARLYRLARAAVLRYLDRMLHAEMLAARSGWITRELIAHITLAPNAGQCAVRLRRCHADPIARENRLESRLPSLALPILGA